MAERLRQGLLALAAAGLEWGVCHGDAQAGNAFLDGEDHLTLIDFDACGPGWPADDLAIAWRAAGGQEDGVHAAFLRGYTEHRALGAVERAALPLFVVLRDFVVLGIATTGVTHGWWECWWLEQEVTDEVTFLKAWEETHLGGGPAL